MNIKELCVKEANVVFGKIQKPEEIVKFYAYKNGESKLFDSRENAKEFSNNIEKVIINQDEIDLCKNKQKEFSIFVDKLFHEKLREEHSDLPDNIYNHCLGFARDRSDSDYELIGELDDITDYTRSLLNMI